MYYEYDIMWRLGRSLSKLVAGTGDLPDVREGEADRSLEIQRICHVATMPLDRLEAKHLDLLLGVLTAATAQSDALHDDWARSYDDLVKYLFLALVDADLFERTSQVGLNACMCFR